MKITYTIRESHSQSWWRNKNNELWRNRVPHRLDGPAFIYLEGEAFQEWWEEGKFLKRI